MAEEQEDERKPGPEPERLKLPHEEWEEAVREALQVSDDEAATREGEDADSEDGAAESEKGAQT